MAAQGKVKMDWDSVTTWEKMVTAIIATGIKIDLHSVAKHYGTTYDTVENRFRKLKPGAAIMKDEVNKGIRGEVAAPRSATSTPKKPKASKKATGALDSVTNGRVSKISPTKKSPTEKGVVKQEMFEGSGNDMFSDATVSFGGREGMSFGSQGLGEDVDLDLYLSMTGMGNSFE